MFNAAWRMSRAAVNVSFTSGVSETLENPTRGKRRRRRRRRRRGVGGSDPSKEIDSEFVWN